MTIIETVKAYNVLHLTGGVTISATGQQTDLAEGYAVALLGYERRIILNKHRNPSSFALVLNHYISKNYRNAKRSRIGDRLNVGIWQDNGSLCFDVVVIVDTLPEALRLGAKNGQIAIYDFENSAVITL